DLCPDRGCETQSQPGRRSRLLPRRGRRAIPASAVLRALAAGDRRWRAASRRQRPGGTLTRGARSRDIIPDTDLPPKTHDFMGLTGITELLQSPGAPFGRVLMNPYS